MESDKNTELIVKYLNGKISERETQDLTNWIKESKENLNTFVQYKELWFVSKSSKQTDSENTDSAWKKFENSKNWDDGISEPNNEKGNVRIVRSTFLKIAASIAILVCTIFSIWIISRTHSDNSMQSLTEVTVPAGDKKYIELSDGTKIWLNSESKLSYPLKFKGKERKVFLSGEAFFDVTKNIRNPFKIETSDLLIQVTGTSFNISSYQDDAYISATLLTGKINIVDLSQKNKTPLILNPNQKASFSKETRQMEILHVDANLYTSWTHNEIIFNNLEFYRVIKKIERWYNVKIDYPEGLFAETRITAKFINDESLSEVLEILQIPGKFQYKIDNNLVTISK